MSRNKEKQSNYYKFRWLNDIEFKKRNIECKKHRMLDLKNKEKNNIRHRMRYKISEVRKTKKLSQAKRQRELGFEPINNYFSHSHAHHINKNQVIYIPKELHLSHYSHRLDRPETMLAINKAVFQYLTDNMKQL